MVECAVGIRDTNELFDDATVVLVNEPDVNGQMEKNLYVCIGDFEKKIRDVGNDELHIRSYRVDDSDEEELNYIQVTVVSECSRDVEIEYEW